MQNIKSEWQPIGKYSLLIDEINRFNTDSFLLADFASPKKNSKVCDLGAGCGIISLLMCVNFDTDKCFSVEIQNDAVTLLKSTVKKNKLDNKIIPILCDLKNKDKLNELIGNNTLDFAVCNPPYYCENSGGKYNTSKRADCREENLCNIYDVAEAAKRLLKHNGSLCVCFKPERLADCFDAFRKNGIEPKRMRMVYSKPECSPGLVLVEGKKGAKPFLKVMPPLVTCSESGIKEMNRIYSITENGD